MHKINNYFNLHKHILSANAYNKIKTLITVTLINVCTKFDFFRNFWFLSYQSVCKE